MNLIVNRQLDQAQSLLIEELTLKKRQCKKSTMSEKHLAARQQLARELASERRQEYAQHFVVVDEHATTTKAAMLAYSPSLSSSATSASSASSRLDRVSSSCGSTCTSATDSLQSTGAPRQRKQLSDTCSMLLHEQQEEEQDLSHETAQQQQQKHMTRAHRSPRRPFVAPCHSTPRAASLSFTRTDSSYSGSSQDSGAQMTANLGDEPSIGGLSSRCTGDVSSPTRDLDDDDSLAQHEDYEHQTTLTKQQQRNEPPTYEHVQTCQTISDSAKASQIELHKKRLELLNDELVMRLNQYESLVAKEKSLLSSCNMALFASESVSNFHSFVI